MKTIIMTTFYLTLMISGGHSWLFGNTQSEADKVIIHNEQQLKLMQEQKRTADALRAAQEAQLAVVKENNTGLLRLTEIQSDKEIKLAEIDYNEALLSDNRQKRRDDADFEIAKIEMNSKFYLHIIQDVKEVIFAIIIGVVICYVVYHAMRPFSVRQQLKGTTNNVQTDDPVENSSKPVPETALPVHDLSANQINGGSSDDVVSRPAHPSDEFSLGTNTTE